MNRPGIVACLFGRLRRLLGAKIRGELLSAVKDDERQIAVDCAQALVTLDSLRQKDLIGGGPSIKADRCNALVAEGMRNGYFPTKKGMEKALKAVMIVSSSE